MERLALLTLPDRVLTTCQHSSLRRCQLWLWEHFALDWATVSSRLETDVFMFGLTVSFCFFPWLWVLFFSEIFTGGRRRGKRGGEKGGLLYTGRWRWPRAGVFKLLGLLFHFPSYVAPNRYPTATNEDALVQERGNQSYSQSLLLAPWDSGS